MSSYACDGLRLADREIGHGVPLLFVHGATGTGEFDGSGLAAACIWPGR
jgi:hypothetical protein